MNRDELLEKLDNVQSSHGQDTIHGLAAAEIRHLLVYIEQLKSDKHWLNERLLNAQTDIQLLQAQARRND
jgi:hypothetical protein